MGPFCYFILFFKSVRILFLLFCIWLDHLSLNLGPAFHSDSWTLLVISYKLLSHWRCFESEVPLQLQSAGGDVSRKRVFWPWNRFDWETVQFEKGTAFYLSFSFFFFFSLSQACAFFVRTNGRQNKFTIRAQFFSLSFRKPRATCKLQLEFN